MRSWRTGDFQHDGVKGVQDHWIACQSEGVSRMDEGLKRLVRMSGWIVDSISTELCSEHEDLSGAMEHHGGSVIGGGRATNPSLAAATSSVRQLNRLAHQL